MIISHSIDGNYVKSRIMTISKPGFNKFFVKIAELI